MLFARKSALILLLALMATACRQSPVSSPPDQGSLPTSTLPSPVVIKANKHLDLVKAFAAHSYNINNLEQGVPPLLLESFPRDFGDIPQIKERKRLFFLSLLPMVMMANDEIRQQRREALYLCQKLDNSKKLSASEAKHLRRLARQYRLETDPVKSALARERLLQRIDVLPPELVLAQAANESGWGTSRFTLKANNLFGEWTFSPGNGVVPQNRPEGATYEVRRFSTLYDSIKSYMNNLNTHRAYKSLRKLRANLRYRGLSLDGFTLSAGLRQYSGRGQAYVDELRAMIRQNALYRFRDLELRPS